MDSKFSGEACTAESGGDGKGRQSVQQEQTILLVMADVLCLRFSRPQTDGRRSRGGVRCYPAIPLK